MSSRISHIIRKFNLEMEFNEAGDPFQLRESLSQVCRIELLPALEKLFDGKTAQGRIIKVDRIVIDAGVLNKENWKASLVENVLQQITSYFSQEHSQKPQAPGHEKGSIVANGFAEINEEENIIQSILHFLRTGLLPWYTNIKSQDALVTYMGQLLQQPDRHFYRQVMAEVQADSYVLKRIVHQLPESALESILRLSDVKPADVKTVVYCWREVFKQDGTLHPFQKQMIYIAALRAIFHNTPPSAFKESVSKHIIENLDLIQIERGYKLVTGEKESLHSLYNASKSDEGETFTIVRQYIVNEYRRRKVKTGHNIFNENEGSEFYSDVPENNDDLSLNRLYPDRQSDSPSESAFSPTPLPESQSQDGSFSSNKISLPGVLPAGESPENDLSGKNTAIPESERGSAATFVKDLSLLKGEDKNGIRSQRVKKLMATLEEEGLYVANAGLVILHPFLVRLFENVGYLENKKWISENHQQRAVLLMQYMVTGKQEFPEFDLLLNKILTGYPLDDTLPVDIVLSDFELQEAHDVLQSVLTHWKALKNTSIPALQSTFFQREGKLIFRDERWLLQVGQQTVDILLNRLSWGISIIKFPWMTNRLHVEWT